MLRRHGIPPAPERRRTTTWAEFIRTHHQTLRLLPEHFDAFREAFLTELARQSKVDDYHVDAWRAVLDAGIAYMNKWPGRRTGESPLPKSPATRADDTRPIATQVYATRGGKDG